MTTLFAISPLDGRYEARVKDLQAYFSEAALMKYRIRVEVEWLIFLCRVLDKFLSDDQLKNLKSLYENFNEESAEAIKDIEKTTNHDVKAIEYFIKRHMDDFGLAELKELVHFACTSEDINNLSYALMIQEARDEVILPKAGQLIKNLYNSALEYKNISMLSRTHGQPASPTTMGKEFVNVVARLQRQYLSLRDQPIFGKMNGAVGNYNAHVVSFPELDWQKLSKEFVEDVLGLNHQSCTTQIEPHDYMAELFHSMIRLDTIFIDFSRDVWLYVSYKFFKQKLKEGEVGSSTMPHKVNPIDFENAEGNLGLANAIFAHLAEKLPVSRMQRDLSDSTVQRNIGVAFGYSLLALESLLKGLSKLEINEDVIQSDLDANWEVLAEPIQMVMRKYNTEGAYEKLKEFSRGKAVNKESVRDFISGLDLPEEEKKSLLDLTPAKYTGLASKLVEDFNLEDC